MTRTLLLSVGEEAGLALRCAQDAAATFRHRAALGAGALATAGKLVAPAILAAYPTGPFARLVDRGLAAVGGEEALHFPAANAAFPRLLEIVDPVATWLFAMPGLVLLAAALPRILAGRTQPRGDAGTALARLPVVLLASLPAAVLAAAAPAVRNGIAERLFGLQGLVAGAMLAVAALALAALLAFALPAVVLGGAGPFAALARSAALAVRFPRFTLAALAVQAVAVSVLAPPPADTAARFDTIPPEAVPWLLAAGSAALGAVEAFRIAMFTRLWLHAYGTVRA